ncbi:MAG TPA: hypothetical protein VJK04_00085 [Candidatus Paceibacterota bacterium]
MKEKIHVPLSEELIRKTSKTVLHAAKKNRRSLFERLTVGNAEKLAQVMTKKPIFYENRETEPTRILLDDKIQGMFPSEFFENPTRWIESRKIVKRGDEEVADLPLGENIAELWDKSYDVTKVKQFTVSLPDKKPVTIVSKRIDAKQLQEVVMARRAYEAGIPTPKVIGEITDRGNNYALFEYLPGINLNAAYWRLYREGRLKHDTNYRSLFNDYNLKELKAHLRHIIPDISPERFSRLVVLWQNALPLNKQREVLISLAPILGYELPKVREDIKLSRARLLLKRGFTNEDIATALRLIGYTNFDQYLESVPWDQNERSEFRARMALSRHASELDGFEEQLLSEIREEIFGVDYQKEMARLEEICKKKEISHKDFAPRNIMILWDFKNDKPLPRKPNEPKLYIIDWES